jgi:hypothetical protein
MAIKHTTGEELHRESDRLNEIGKYHMVIIDATEEVLVKGGPNKGNLVSGALFQVTAQVGAGTTLGQENKTCDITFFAESPNDKDFSRQMNAMRKDKFYLATNLLPAKALRAVMKGAKEELKLEPGVDFEINAADMVGQQFIASFDSMDKDGKYLKTDWVDAYHIDDPAMAAVPKNEGLLGLIDPKDRWVGGRPQGVAAPVVNAPATTTSATGKAPSASKPAAAKQSTPVAPVTTPATTPAMATAFDDV